MIVLVARIVLAAVFAVAGVGKLVRGSGTEATMAEFGVSDGLRRPLALALPLAELAIAVALLPAATAPWAGVAAVLVLIAFTTAVARVLARGEEVDCNCFGSLGPSLITGWTLSRNGALLVLAAVVA
ncbi:MAG TPA: MauE/DoxX family redox-associated membrane protein, partial [Solirubrobacterales bacterium]|nr:MauE/DoxX family redox-associated membrane protein [Solirubrobacterales bacterium]